MTEEVSASKARKPRATAQVAEASVPEVTTPVSNVQSKDNNVIGSGAADRALQKLIVSEPAPDQSNKVALWADKNMRWQDVGTLAKGYNIVTKEAAAKWVEKGFAREATPEEVATFYGK
jgi:hypothetical protein